MKEKADVDVPLIKKGCAAILLQSNRCLLIFHFVLRDLPGYSPIRMHCYFMFQSEDGSLLSIRSQNMLIFLSPGGQKVTVFRPSL
jgi:hypothetical protein